MSKKNQTKRRFRVADIAWNETPEGVLDMARRLHREHRFTDVVVIGVRKDGSVDTLTYTNDRYRVVGIVRWALDRLAGKIGQ